MSYIDKFQLQCPLLAVSFTLLNKMLMYYNWNINELARKIHDPDFISELTKNDIISK